MFDFRDFHNHRFITVVILKLHYILKSHSLVHPTPQELFDLSAGLGRSELVNNVQCRLAVGVSHCGVDTTLPKGRKGFSHLKCSFFSLMAPTSIICQRHLLHSCNVSVAL